MKVVLQTSLFEHPDTMRLDAVAHLALTNWHRIIFEEEESPAVQEWMSRLDIGHQEKWQELIRAGYILETREPARKEIHVSGAMPTDWKCDPPRATLEDALSFLRRPFRAMLEDRVSDRHFLLKMATNEQRKALLDSEKSGLLEYVHGGGISSMPRTIDAWAAEGSHGHLRGWVLFDSDALRPSEPSEQSELLKDKCRDADVPHYRLKRRNIENYVPTFALSNWTYNSGSKKQREKQFLAFIELSADQRSHYNMKDGFRGDRNRHGKSAGNLFAGIGDLDKVSLEDGFGKDIGGVFATEAVKEEHLKKDLSWNEINPVVTDLIALLR